MLSSRAAAPGAPVRYSSRGRNRKHRQSNVFLGDRAPALQPRGDAEPIVVEFQRLFRRYCRFGVQVYCLLLFADSGTSAGPQIGRIRDRKDAEFVGAHGAPRQADLLGIVSTITIGAPRSLDAVLKQRESFEDGRLAAIVRTDKYGHRAKINLGLVVESLEAVDGEAADHLMATIVTDRTEPWKELSQRAVAHSPSIAGWYGNPGWIAGVSEVAKRVGVHVLNGRPCRQT